MKNSYLTLPEMFYQEAKASHFPRAQLLFYNQKLAKELGLSLEKSSDKELTAIFSGEQLLPNSHPIALAYAAHQFGHSVPLLGDGRALLLGEINGQDIQLKGSGQTGFSRRGDGRSALGPVIREYIVSEFMHTLGIPTTRALAAVSSGEEVYRQFGPEPGGIFTRVAESHLRVGTFQLPSFRKDIDSLTKLLSYTLKRHYPELLELSLREQALGFLEMVSRKQGELIAHWSGVGFIHGVMNTDNCSVAGITIDYGPCAFMDEFEFNKVFSSIDERGRYSFFNQVPIIQWNILRLADCLLPLISSDQDEAVKVVGERLHPILSHFHFLRMEKFAKKLGINDYQEKDETLVMNFLKYLEDNSVDFTLGFRKLSELYNNQNTFYPRTDKLEAFIVEWKNRVDSIDGLGNINPIYIPRNHLIQKAIDLSYQGDISFSQKLIKVLEDPFSEKEELKEFSLPPEPSEKVSKTYCGT